MSKIVCAFVWGKCLYKLANELDERRDGARGTFAQGGFELGESLLDRIEIGRVGRKIAHGCADGRNRFAHALDLVGSQVVHKNNVTLRKRWGENLLDIGNERSPVHGAVNDVRCSDAIDAQSSDERQRFPVAMRHLRNESLTTRGATVVTDHLRRDRGLVDEDEALRFESGLLSFQIGACSGDIRTILLGGVQRFFLKVIS